MGLCDVTTRTFPWLVTIQVSLMYFNTPSQPPVFIPYTNKASVLGEIQHFGSTALNTLLQDFFFCLINRARPFQWSLKILPLWDF